jgi:hypothetical protein
MFGQKCQGKASPVNALEDNVFKGNACKGKTSKGKACYS